MKQFIIIFSLLLFSSQIFAQIPAGYYDGTDGLEGSELKTALFGIIKNPSVSSYDGLWTEFKTTDRDYYYENDATVMDIYSENPTGTDPYTYHYTSDQCGNYSDEGVCYNREHSFPKSWFNEASPMYSDLFHLYPTDGYVNGKRSNYPYGNVASASWTSDNGSKLGTCSSPNYSGTVFEPIDEFKGDLARTYFYMATCYEDKIASWNSAALAGNSFPAYTDWYLEIMLQWNALDPVSQKEIDRNNAIYDIQGNRNPYIDHPEWVEYVWGSGIGVQNPNDFTASASSTSQIDLSWTLNTAGDQVILAYNTTNNFGTPTGTYTVGNTISGGGEVLYVGTNTNFPHNSLSSQMYYYKIWSYDGTDYSTGAETSASPLLPEPTNNATAFVVIDETANAITLTWNDATGGQLPSYYLVKASIGSISNPSDGTYVTSNSMNKNIAYGVESVTFTGLSSETTYNFKIFPYTNSGSEIDYKIDGTPSTSGTTLVATDPILVITEIAGKGYNEDYNDEYIEISNIGDMAADLTDWTFEYYEGSSPEADLNLTGTINPLSTYVIAVRTSYSAINPDFVPSTGFHINNNFYAVLKENGVIKDQAGSSTDKFNDASNYEFTNCTSDNLPVSNWTDLGLGNGTPGTINCSDISVEDINSKIKIYPNPANQIVNINSLNNIKDINIFNVIGQKVLSFNNLNTDNYEINISSLIKGIYFIEVIDNNNKILKKLIKE